MARRCANCNKRLIFTSDYRWLSSSFRKELYNKRLCNNCFRILLKEQSETKNVLPKDELKVADEFFRNSCSVNNIVLKPENLSDQSRRDAEKKLEKLIWRISFGGAVIGFITYLLLIIFLGPLLNTMVIQSINTVNASFFAVIAVWIILVFVAGMIGGAVTIYRMKSHYKEYKSTFGEALYIDWPDEGGSAGFLMGIFIALSFILLQTYSLIMFSSPISADKLVYLMVEFCFIGLLTGLVAYWGALMGARIYGKPKE
jgi:hypothetical protein